MSRRKNIDRSGYIYGYPKHLPDGQVKVEDSQGKLVGYGRVVSRSKIRPGQRGDWISNERVSYRVLGTDNRQYHGRGYGEGMALTLRPMKGRK